MNSVLLAVHDPAQAAVWGDALRASRQWLVLEPVRSFGAAQRSMSQLRPQLLIADLRLLDGTVLNVVRSLRSDLSALPTQVLVATQSDDRRADDELLLRALQEGADNFVCAASAKPAELLQLAQDTLAGGAEIAPWIARRLLNHFGVRGPMPSRAVIEELSNPLCLTEAERALLVKLSNGFRVAELARVEGVGPRELTSRVREIYRKMQWRLRAGGLSLKVA